MAFSRTVTQLARSRPVQGWLIAVLAVMALVSLAQGCMLALSELGSQDFQYTATRYLLNGANPHEVFRREGVSAFMLYQYPNYLPLIHFVLLPLAALPWDAAKAAWLVLNVGMTLAIAVLILRRAEDRRLGLIAALLFLSALPVRATLGNGQASALMCFAIVLALMAPHPFAKGLLLALATTKYSIGAFFVAAFFGAGRVGTVLICVAALVASFLGLALATGSAIDAHLFFGPLAVNRTVFAVYGPFLWIQDVFGYAWLLVIPLLGLALCVALPRVARCGGTLDFTQPQGLRLLLAVTLASLAFAPHADYDFYLLALPFVFGNPFKLLQRVDAVLLALVLAYFWNLRKIAKELLSVPHQDLLFTVVWVLMLVLFVRLVLRMHADARGRPSAARP